MLDDHTHIAVSTDLAKDVAKAGVHGKAFFFHSPDLEDSHFILGTTEDVNGGKWLTGANAYDEHVKAALGLAPDHRLVAFLYLGTIEGRPPTVPHADAREHTVEWSG